MDRGEGEVEFLLLALRSACRLGSWGVVRGGFRMVGRGLMENGTKWKLKIWRWVVDGGGCWTGWWGCWMVEIPDILVKGQVHGQSSLKAQNVPVVQYFLC